VLLASDVVAIVVDAYVAFVFLATIVDAATYVFAYGVVATYDGYVDIDAFGFVGVVDATASTSFVFTVDIGNVVALFSFIQLLVALYNFLLMVSLFVMF
jgi:hypothetical protein